MRRLLLQVLSVSLLGLSVGAHASTISAGTYSLNNVTILDSTNHSFTLTGDLTLNASGIVTSADIMLNDPAIGSPVFNVVSSAGGPSGYAPVADYAYISGSSGQVVLYYLTTTNPSGNIDLCINGVSCNSYQASYSQIYISSLFGYNAVDLRGGTLVDPPAVAAVPEPASFALLATGVLGAAGAIRRRFVQR